MKQFDSDNSGNLFNHIKQAKGLKTETELADYLGEYTSAISAIRHGRKTINENMLERIRQRTRISRKRLEDMIAGVAA